MEALVYWRLPRAQADLASKLSLRGPWQENTGYNVRYHKPPAVHIRAIQWQDGTIDFFRQHFQNAYKHGRLYHVGLRISPNKGSI
jgi:hypothetical protein